MIMTMKDPFGNTIRIIPVSTLEEAAALKATNYASFFDKGTCSAEHMAGIQAVTSNSTLTADQQIAAIDALS